MKIKQVVSKLKQLKKQIAFIQETHLLSSEYTPLKRRWQGQVVSASFSSHARGVAVLVHSSVQLRVINIVRDTAGRFVIAQG